MFYHLSQVSVQDLTCRHDTSPEPVLNICRAHGGHPVLRSLIELKMLLMICLFVHVIRLLKLSSSLELSF